MEAFKTVTDLKNYLAKIEDHLLKGECPPGLNFTHCRQCGVPTQYHLLMEEGICALCRKNNKAEYLGTVMK